MKSRTISQIIIEGCDGVGKDTVAFYMWKRKDTPFRVYVRGELSDYVYAKKFNRPFISTQRGLPILYVLLTCKKDKIKDRIIGRQRNEDIKKEIEKSNDQDLFLDALHSGFEKDYHTMIVDTTDKTPQEIANYIYLYAQDLCESLKKDDSINEYNNMYKRGCDKLGIKFSVRNNQPYFDEIPIMADAQLHNGAYETYTDKIIPHNLIFSLGYDNIYHNKKTFNFCYIIGSKINVRQEVNEYFEAFDNANLSCMKKSDLPDKVFGDNYLSKISCADATIYVSRDLAYLEMITVRPYEATLATQMLFVDSLTDKDNKILSQIYDSCEDKKEAKRVKKLLYVTPKTIAKNYSEIKEKDRQFIINAQIKWYNKLCSECYQMFQNKHE